MTEDKMVGCQHQLNAHEFEQAPGDGEGQGSLGCWSPWGCKELDTTEWLNNNIVFITVGGIFAFENMSYKNDIIFGTISGRKLIIFYTQNKKHGIKANRN